MKLIVASNRVSYDETPHAGGLAAAIQDTFKDLEGIWMGWSGAISEDPEYLNGSTGNLQYKVFSLTQKEYDDYYLSFSNEVIWPICHLRPNHLRLVENSYPTYLRVNQRFAHEILKVTGDQDLVWVHDYHLLLTGQALRAQGFSGAIGYFHHIPIPPVDLARTIPHHTEILAGLLHYDVVGVQTHNDLKNIVDYLSFHADVFKDATVLSQTPHSVHIEHQHRITKIAVYPISIDTTNIEKIAAQSLQLQEVSNLQASIENQKLVIGVDRIDYSKGLENKFHAFEKCLGMQQENKMPVLLQIANKSRNDIPSYQNLCASLESLASNINGDHGNPSYAPIRYVNTAYDHATLTGFYRLACVGLVTPAKDGMNLVAKEYVASQDPQDPGVLVLSEFAGAADEMPEALLVNPFHTLSVAQSIHRALHMPRLERIQRHRALMKRLRSHDIQHWHQSFMRDMFAAHSALHTPERMAS